MNLNKLHNDIHEGALQLMAEHRTQLFAKASHRAMSVYNATLAEAWFVSSARIGPVIVDTYVRGGEELIAYYRPDDIRLGNRAPHVWKEGNRVVPRDGIIVDLLSGRIYRRPDILPLSDHPYLWRRKVEKNLAGTRTGSWTTTSSSTSSPTLSWNGLGI